MTNNMTGAPDFYESGDGFDCDDCGFERDRLKVNVNTSHPRKFDVQMTAGCYGGFGQHRLGPKAAMALLRDNQAYTDRLLGAGATGRAIKWVKRHGFAETA
ncbi:hypothetical protein [Salinibacterium sp. ZJ454]|uniref:hypothetical protein n=1 Tax=Salinibacterium sp. ZJ454 TaxID=2708339 RepID=UPI00141FB91E|nr:hypothetical protein [Salinibacterium sp. ZJ454]